MSHWKLGRRCEAFELIKDSLSPMDRQLALEVLYVQYMGNARSAYTYEDEEDLINGEVTKKFIKVISPRSSLGRGQAWQTLKASLTTTIVETSPLMPDQWQSPGLRVKYRKGQYPTVYHGPWGRPVHNKSLGPVVQRLISTNTGLHCNHVSFFFRSKAFLT